MIESIMVFGGIEVSIGVVTNQNLCSNYNINLVVWFWVI